MIPRDKLLHFVTGAAGRFGMAIAFRIGGSTPRVSVMAGIGLGAVSGVGKELYDWKHPANHTAEIWDALATILGATILGATVRALIAQLVWRG